MDEKKCIKWQNLDDNCLKYKIDSDICEECINDYIFFKDVCMSKGDCEEYEIKLQSFKCLKCKDYYYLNEYS